MAMLKRNKSEYAKEEKSGEGRRSAFLCLSHEDINFVKEVANFLKSNFDHIYYYEEGQIPEESFWETIDRELLKCEVFILFVPIDNEPTGKQIKEVKRAYGIHESSKKRKFVSCLLGQEDFPDKLKTAELGDLKNYPIVKAVELSTAEKVAKGIMKALRMPYKQYDGLPSNPHLFSYEKDIINHFVNLSRHRSGSSDGSINGLSHERIKEIKERELEGCPQKWPDVECWSEGTRNLADEYRKIGVNAKKVRNNVENWISTVGNLRKKDAKVIVAALTDYHKPARNGSKADCCLMDATMKMCFPEAGPREFMYFPRDQRELNVAILVSGGIAPGTNAVIDGIVQRHRQYAKEFAYMDGLSIVGIKNGFLAFNRWGSNKSKMELKELRTAHMASQGGSLLGTSRDNDLLTASKKRSKKLNDIIEKLYSSEIDILYIIGGDGSMKAAHALWTVAQQYAKEHDEPKLSVVAIPKTMDNDILWVWQTFGFLSAVEKAREIIDHLATEVESNPRLCVVQLFGSDSGYVVSHAVLASRPKQCDVALIPEVDFTIKKLTEHLKSKMDERILYEFIRRGLVVMAETAIPLDAMNFVDDTDIGLTEEEKDEIRKFEILREKNKRIQGQTSDHLRSAGLKIVSRGLHKLLDKKRVSERRRQRLRRVTNEPRHLLRALPPSCTDIIMGNRLGTLAVDNALAGYTDFMVSQWLTEYVLVPLELVVLGRKRIPKTGIFWKSVIAKTGQPADLT
jgi:6-phosphofructokinase 1